eukprot:2583414-Amphidinium_carterae.1
MEVGPATLASPVLDYIMAFAAKVSLDPLHSSFSASQPPPLHEQVPYFALHHATGRVCVSALHSPAVAVISTSQRSCLPVRYHGRLALYAQELDADSRLIHRVPLSCLPCPSIP